MLYFSETVFNLPVIKVYCLSLSPIPTWPTPVSYWIFKMSMLYKWEDTYQVKNKCYLTGSKSSGTVLYDWCTARIHVTFSNTSHDYCKKKKKSVQWIHLPSRNIFGIFQKSGICPHPPHPFLKGIKHLCQEFYGNIRVQCTTQKKLTQFLIYYIGQNLYLSIRSWISTYKFWGNDIILRKWLSIVILKSFDMIYINIDKQPIKNVLLLIFNMFNRTLINREVYGPRMPSCVMGAKRCNLL